MRIFTILRFLLVSAAAYTLASPVAFALEEKPQLPVVFVSQLKPVELFDSLTYPARVIPKINTTLLAETDGVILKISAPWGQKVRPGQTILTITHTDPIYQYAPARVSSPVSGIVSTLEVTEGTQVSKGQKIGSVTDPAQIRVVVEVPALDVSSLYKGLQGEFTLAGRAGALPVRIRGLSPFVDPATGTATCEIEFENLKKGMVMPGIVGQVSFKANIRRGISIPDSAVNYKGSETFVKLVENSKAKKVAVRLGNRQKGFVEILEGLKENSALIERASKSVADGKAVTVQTGAAPQRDPCIRPLFGSISF
ncbi:efflux RND transporter periplasmic adaptor subunit [Bdellovibrionota bacterium FG-2]